MIYLYPLLYFFVFTLIETMNKIINDYIDLIVKAKWWVENLYWIPTDIIWFNNFWREIAHQLEKYVSKKEICFFDEIIKSDPDYHYLEFVDMFKKSELMIFVTDLDSSYFESIATLNPEVTIVINGDFKRIIHIFLDNWFIDNLIIV